MIAQLRGMCNRDLAILFAWVSLILLHCFSLLKCDIGVEKRGGFWYNDT